MTKLSIRKMVVQWYVPGVAIGENVQHIYIYGFICVSDALQICERVLAVELQGVREITASLPHLKLKMHHSKVRGL